MESFALTASAEGRMTLDEEDAPSATSHQASEGALVRMLDVVDYGILLVCADNRVTFANRTARLELTDCHPLQLCGQRLSARQRQDSALLRDAVDAALRRGTQRLLALGGRASHRVNLAVLPVEESSGVPSSDVIVVLGKRRICGELSAEAFARQHRLTPAELKVLKLLCSGYPAADIAKLQGVALTTIRTQISSVRDKTGTPNIGALVRCVAALPPLVNRLLHAA